VVKENKEENRKEVSRKGSFQLSENSNTYESAPVKRNEGRYISYLEDKNTTEFNKETKSSFQDLNISISNKKTGRHRKLNIKNLVVTKEIELNFSQIMKNITENNAKLKEKQIGEAKPFTSQNELTSKNQDQRINISKYEENIIFSYLKVMKNIVTSFNTSPEEDYGTQIQLSEQTYLDTDENQEKEIKKENDTENKFTNGVFKVILILIVILLNYFVMRNEMFLRVYMFIILSNDTKRSISSGNIKKMSLCSKRW